MKNNIIGIAWAKSSPRLDGLLQSLNGRSYKIGWTIKGKFFSSLKYIFLSIRTIHLLIKTKPDIIIAQNPPIFCPLIVYIYTKIFNKKFLIDHHSLFLFREGIFWRFLSVVEIKLMKKAMLNIVIHDNYRKILEKRDIKALTIFDQVPIIINDENKYDIFTVIFPLGGHPDEDIELLQELAHSLKNIQFITTGVMHKNLNNIKQLGFLPYREYVKVLKKSHIGICLIKNNQWTFPHVVFEFLGANIPFLVTKTYTTKALGENFLVANKKELMDKIILLTDLETYKHYLEHVKKIREKIMIMRELGIKELKKCLSSINP